MNARLLLALVAITALAAVIWFAGTAPESGPDDPPTGPAVSVLDDDGGLAVHSVDLPEVTLAVLPFSDGAGKVAWEYSEALPRLQAALTALGHDAVPAPWLMVQGVLGERAEAAEQKPRVSFATPVPDDIDLSTLRAAGFERHVIQGGGGLRLEIASDDLESAMTKADSVLTDASAREGRDILGRRWFRPLPSESGVRFEVTADMRDEPSVIDAQGPR